MPRSANDVLAHGRPARPLDFPGHPFATRGRGKVLSWTLLDHSLPPRKRETHAVVEHRLAPVGQPDGAPEDADHALLVGRVVARLYDAHAHNACPRRRGYKHPFGVRDGLLHGLKLLDSS